VGKPSALLIDYIVQKHHTVPARMCMVGDRLDTDIAFGKILCTVCVKHFVSRLPEFHRSLFFLYTTYTGKSNGLRTILTLSGVTTEEALFNADRTAQPEFYVNSIADFYA